MWDRALHAWYRRRARLQLRSLRTAPETLFVCRANLCRSPYAAAAFLRDPRAKARAFRASSAGFAMSRRPTPVLAVSAAAARGVVLSDHLSEAVTTEIVAKASLVVVMEPSQVAALRARIARTGGVIIVLGDLDPSPFQPRAIHDPIAGTPSDFAATYARIDRCVDALLDVLADAP